jgi:hypothetical protein
MQPRASIFLVVSLLSACATKALSFPGLCHDTPPFPKNSDGPAYQIRSLNIDLESLEWASCTCIRVLWGRDYRGIHEVATDTFFGK